jgi:hypothetical protein
VGFSEKINPVGKISSEKSCRTEDFPHAFLEPELQA